MGLFGKKVSAAPDTDVPFEQKRALPLTNVKNLQASLAAIAAKINWSDQDKPSPVLQASLQPGVDTYGKPAIGVWISKTCIGYLGGPASRGMTATRAAVVLERHGHIIGFVCPEK